MNNQEKVKIKELTSYSQKLHDEVNYMKLNYDNLSSAEKCKTNRYLGIAIGIDYVLKELGCVSIEKG